MLCVVALIIVESGIPSDVVTILVIVRLELFSDILVGIQLVVWLLNVAVISLVPVSSCNFAFFSKEI